MRRTAVAASIVCFAPACCSLSAQQDSRRENAEESTPKLFEVARKGLALAEKPSPGEREAYSGVCIWSKRVLEAQLQVSANTQERIAAREKHLERMTELESTAKRLFARDMISRLELLENQFNRCEAQLELDLEKQGKTYSQR